MTQELVMELIDLGTKASTRSNMQPWGFQSIQGRDKLDSMSESIKQGGGSRWFLGWDN